MPYQWSTEMAGTRRCALAFQPSGPMFGLYRIVRSISNPGAISGSRCHDPGEGIAELGHLSVGPNAHANHLFERLERAPDGSQIVGLSCVTTDLCYTLR